MIIVLINRLWKWYGINIICEEGKGIIFVYLLYGYIIMDDGCVIVVWNLKGWFVFSFFFMLIIRGDCGWVRLENVSWIWSRDLWEEGFVVWISLISIYYI